MEPKFDLRDIQKDIVAIQKEIILKNYQSAYAKCTFLWRKIDKLAGKSLTEGGDNEKER